MSRVSNAAGALGFSVSVVGGTGYYDFVATGQITAVIVTAPGSTTPVVSWVITDAKGRGISGGPVLAQPSNETNVALSPPVTCLGQNRITLNSNIDGTYIVTVYGSGDFTEGPAY